VKLLFDHNLSPRLVRQLADIFLHCAHVRDFSLHHADDIAIWQFAIENDFMIVSKDSDFHQLAFVKGPPPKVVWIQRGNCDTEAIRRLLHASETEITAFARNEAAAFLILS